MTNSSRKTAMLHDRFRHFTRCPILLKCLTASAIMLAARFSCGDDATSSIADALDGAIAGRQVGETREESGQLTFTDDTLDSGEYYDQYSFRAEKGDVLVIDLFSEVFDPYLIVMSDSNLSDFQLDNDDYVSGDTTHSHITFMAPATDTYLALGTSFEAGETGRYRMTIRDVTPETRAGSGQRTETGKLSPGDAQLDDGEFVDDFPLTAEAGDLILVDLRSDDFDTYLMITGPDGSGFVLENDDHDQSTSHSRILMIAPLDGDYQIRATSFDARETGEYELTIRDL